MASYLGAFFDHPQVCNMASCPVVCHHFHHYQKMNLLPWWIFFYEFIFYTVIQVKTHSWYIFNLTMLKTNAGRGKKFHQIQNIAFLNAFLFISFREHRAYLTHNINLSLFTSLQNVLSMVLCSGSSSSSSGCHVIPQNETHYATYFTPALSKRFWCFCIGLWCILGGSGDCFVFSRNKHFFTFHWLLHQEFLWHQKLLCFFAYWQYQHFWMRKFITTMWKN